MTSNASDSLPFGAEISDSSLGKAAKSPARKKSASRKKATKKPAAKKVDDKGPAAKRDDDKPKMETKPAAEEAPNTSASETKTEE